MSGKRHLHDDAEGSSLLSQHNEEEILIKEHFNLPNLQIGQVDTNHNLVWYRRIIYVLVAICTVSIFGGIMVYIQLGRKEQVLLRSQELVPHLSRHVITFSPDARFENADPFSAAQNAWTELFPIGKGHIIVDRPSQWGLEGGYRPPNHEENSDAEVYTISVFHQLHCLATIKSTLHNLNLFNTSSSAASSSQSLPITVHAHVHHLQGDADNNRPHIRASSGHIGHCIEYIRQAIMCAGDTSLEKAKVNERTGEQEHDTDGWGVQHVCRDWQGIMQWAEEKRSSDRGGLE